MFENIYKLFIRHKHQYTLVAVNDDYTTTFSDQKTIVKWHMRYYHCEGCGQRAAEKTHDYHFKFVHHAGVEAAVKNWIDSGVVPVNSYDPVNKVGYVKMAVNNEVDKANPVAELNNLMQDMCDMLCVINRDFDIESKYPKLKAAANNYNRLFEKYKTFEDLKAGRHATNK